MHLFRFQIRYGNKNRLFEEAVRVKTEMVIVGLGHIALLTDLLAPNSEYWVARLSETRWLIFSYLFVVLKTAAECTDIIRP